MCGDSQRTEQFLVQLPRIWVPETPFDWATIVSTCISGFCNVRWRPCLPTPDRRRTVPHYCGLLAKTIRRISDWREMAPVLASIRVVGSAPVLGAQALNAPLSAF